MPKSKDKEYVHLGKSIETILQRDYLDGNRRWGRLIWLSLIRGIFAGVGSVLGATLVIAILIWVLGVFDNIPLVGRVFESILRTIQKQ